MRLEIDIPEHHYNNIMAIDSVSLGRAPYKGIIMYAINAIKQGKILEQEPTTKNDLGVDCISRKAVLNQIFYSTDNSGDVVLGSALRERIERLSSVTPQEPRWIPVSEYLPVTNDEVLVTYIVNGNTKKRYVETANCFDGEWSSVNDEYRIPNTKIEIIAWCEMPKPYREVKE